MNKVLLNKVQRLSLLSLLLVFVAGCSSVQVQQVSDKKHQEKYVLTAYYAEPVKNFESRSLRSNAKELCPQGFDILNSNASKAGKLAISHASCVSLGSCDYKLEWHIQCADRPQEPFSLFGRF